VGKIQQVSDPTGTYGFAYDNMGRLIGTTTQYSFVPGTTFTNSYTYDAASNRVSFTAPDGSTAAYNYDTLNRLNTLNSSLTGQFTFSYDALSRRTQLVRPNGVNTSYQYDALSRLLAITHQASGTTVDGAGYAYDFAGNRTAKGNFLDGSMEQYTYDPIYQLTQVTHNSTVSETYAYDAVGNRLSSLTVPSLTYNGSNELLSTSRSSYTYDNNGNLVSKTNSSGTTGFTWDYENRLTSVTLPGSGGTVTFKYDPFGRRIQKNGQAGTTNYLYDGANAVTDVNASGAVVASYTQGSGVDEPLTSVTAVGTAFFEADGLGSITSLSGASGVTDTYTYKPFGITTATGTNSNRFRFTGREWDQETGLYYYRARYYDPATGRFLSEDPLGFDGGGANFYAYVGNHPVDFVDPLGLAKSAAQCAEILKQIKFLTGLLAKELAKYDPVLDAAGGPTWKRGGHYIEMGSYVTGIMNNAADYYQNCRKCDGNPVIPGEVWKTVKEYLKVPKPYVPSVPIPDELVNWYEPSTWEQFNKFMNRNFGGAPAQGTQLPPYWQQLLRFAPAVP
jgi:RHS repeat-associated protein